jgi:hypothetical protein
LDRIIYIYDYLLIILSNRSRFVKRALAALQQGNIRDTAAPLETASVLVASRGSA